MTSERAPLIPQRNRERAADVGTPPNSFGPRKPQFSRTMRQRLADPFVAIPLAILGLAVLMAVIVVLVLINTLPELERPLSQDQLLQSLHTDNIQEHLQALEESAQASGGSRSIANGYNASADYIISVLTAHATGWCDVEKQAFVAPVWEELKPASLEVAFLGGLEGRVRYQEGVDFRSMRYGGQSATLKNQQIVEIPHHGCNVSDFTDVRGKIALIREGFGSEGAKCDLWTAAWNAEQAKATAVIIYNSPTRLKLLYSRIRIVAWKEGDPLMTIPVVAASHSLGKTLAMIAGEGGLVDLATNTKITLHHTYNVLCIGHRGDDDQRVLVGAHLDSVPAGLGLVDNASGSATLLEILLVLNTHHPKYHPRNKIVFAWWGAEEVGLLGSRHYVRSLSPEERSKIALNLNFDMLASPNGVPFIHNGTDAPLAIRNASLQLQRGFEQFFHRKGRPYEITDMVIGSDFLPFLEGGIPAGGVLTGAGELKTVEQRHTFGGFANTPMDPCYHKSCDTYENVNEDLLDVMSHAAMYVISRLGRQKDLQGYLQGDAVLEVE